MGPAAADTCLAGDDADCDGTPNEKCECKNGETRACGSKIGSCKQGTQTCADAQWGDCIGEVKAAALDSCAIAGDDANCDGKVNDKCPCVGTQTQICGGCGSQTCAPALRQWGECSATVSTSACGNCGTRTCNANGMYGSCVPAAPKCVDASHSEVCPAAAAPDWVVTTCSANTTCTNATCLKNNGQSCALSGECASGQCNIFYRDADGDGYGTSATSILVCGTSAPTGYLANKLDCCDSDNVAHPGQVGLFDVPNACGSFDYDCVNGAAHDPNRNSVFDCGPTFCTSGFDYDMGIPACGTTGYWKYCAYPTGCSLDAPPVGKIVQCH